MICKDFTWSLMRQQFSTDVLLVRLGSCEMVLSVQCLSILGSILWNFEQLKMEFSYKGKSMVLRGTQNLMRNEWQVKG